MRKKIVVSLILILANIAYAQVPVCKNVLVQKSRPNVFQRILSVFRPRVPEIPKHLDTRMYAEALKKYPYYKQWHEQLGTLLSDYENPYTLTFDLRDYAEQSGQNSDLLLKDLLLILAGSPPEQLAPKLNFWIQSDEQALMIYDLIVTSSHPAKTQILSSLITYNPFFRNSSPIQDSGNSTLVTYAFEKEGSSPDITLLYRPPEVPEDDWLALDTQTRLTKLREVPLDKRVFATADTIAPTSLRPSYLSGYSEDVEAGRLKGYGWEVSHKKYEINKERAFAQISDLARMFKETHSIHAHLVFEVPERYQKENSFRYWFKHINDFLYLRGLEEGLHGNLLTGIVNVDQYGSRAIPLLHQLTSSNGKFFSAGLRGKIYGPASQPNRRKIGLELRDTTRNLGKLKEYLDNLSQSIKSYDWENNDGKVKDIAALTPRLDDDINNTQSTLATIVDKKTAAQFAAKYPSLSMGLIHYEEGQYFNYKTKMMEPVSAEKAEQIRSARELLIKDLINLQKEIADYRERQEKIDSGLIEAAIKMIVSDWAKRAQISELYSNF